MCVCVCMCLHACEHVCTCIWVYVCLCVSSWFKVSSMTPITSAPLGSVFPLFPQLSPGSLPRCPHTPAHTQGPFGSCPFHLTTCLKDPPCSLADPSLSGSCMMPVSACQHILDLSACLSSSPQSVGFVRAGACLILGCNPGPGPGSRY